jgi:hypothetical protein
VLALLIEQLVDGAPQCWNDGATFLGQRGCDQNLDIGDGEHARIEPVLTYSGSPEASRASNISA